MGDVEDHRLREELRSCQHFVVDSELEKARHKSLQLCYGEPRRKSCPQKTDLFFNNLKCAAKVNLAFGFILRNIEDGGFRYLHDHENNTLRDRSKLLCTRDNLAKLKHFLNKTDVIDLFRRERLSTKWSFYMLTNLTVFAALLKDVRMRCKDAVLHELFLKSAQSTVSRLKRIRDNHITTTCVFFAHLLSLGTEINDWKKKPQIYSIYSRTKWMD